ncbi:hypothetical protein [Janibacter corallicola]|uniref:hypothetical protein n=1 Tax=Janibacter corallicola TaxID=415212 RepID=UPI00082A10E4|nr:hypothetical protein [Janibacter corallicola]
MADVEIVTHGDGEYEVNIRGGDGSTSHTLLLDAAQAASGGQLADDERTARATIAYLLEHQDAGDLPQLIDLEEVLAAYEGATERIVALRE